MSARLGAFFFLLRQEPMPSLDELATAAGVTSLSRWPWPEDDDEDVLCGLWSGVLSVEARLQHLDLHDLLVIDFWQGEFLDLLPPPTDLDGNDALTLEQDGALPVAIAFRDASERLHPEAAVLATRPHMIQDPQWLHACYSAVLGMDPTLLDSYGGGLVYVGPDMVAEWEPDHFGTDRDSLPVAGGRLLFRGTGWGRWF